MVMRAQGFTLQEITDKLGFYSRGSTKIAIDAAIQRASAEWTPGRARQVLLAGAQDSAKSWAQKVRGGPRCW